MTDKSISPLTNNALVVLSTPSVEAVGVAVDMEPPARTAQEEGLVREESTIDKIHEDPLIVNVDPPRDEIIDKKGIFTITFHITRVIHTCLLTH